MDGAVMGNPQSIGEIYLETATRNFRGLKTLAEKAIEQVGDSDLDWSSDPESNSIAILIKHLGGNMISRWTDFLTTDGEKPDRDRDREFVGEGQSRAELMKLWDDGWSRLLGAISSLGPEDLDRIVTIRGEEHTVILAINRQVSHCAYHIGQIVYVAKALRRDEWKNLSMPRKRP